MNCPVCHEEWDLQQVRPKGLPCQHSVCCTCLTRLTTLRCPTCRQAFKKPVADNFALVAVLGASELKRPQVWWCMDCRAGFSARCVVDNHDLKRPKAALRCGLEELSPRLGQHLKRLKTGLQGVDDRAALDAMQLLDGRPTVQLLFYPNDDKGKAVSFKWRIDGRKDVKEDLFKTLVVALAASGCAVHEGPPETVPPGGELFRSVVHQPTETPNLGSLSTSSYFDTDEKAAALLFCRQWGVRRIPGFSCKADPVWCRDVLKVAAPTLEELQLYDFQVQHLVALQNMPILRRLHLQVTRFIHFGSMAIISEDELCDPPAGPKSLKCLRMPVRGFSPVAAQSFLMWYAASLDVLWLEVNASGDWPEGCAGLDELLRPCALRLSRLVLLRSGCDDAACRAQLQAVRVVLPGCTVQCERCDGVPREAF